MEVRNAIHPSHARALDTQGLRRELLISGLFAPGAVKLVYSHVDRVIVGGACPVAPLSLPGGGSITGGTHLLERRELGLINVGSAGVVAVDGTEYPLARLDGLYVGMGARQVVFHSAKPEEPARFYFNCAPAHHAWPAQKIDAAGVKPVRLGGVETANQREIRKYIHPDGVRSCQLVMGLTRLAPGSVWNTMPCHTHVRRMEVYFYFDLAADAVVFHLMGEPGETRHLVVRNEEALISPSWSIHSGVGTRSYSFIWGMLGENQVFDDMDAVSPADLM